MFLSLKNVRTMIEYSHAFGIALFADISFALKQQHAMRMIYAKDLPTQLQEIRATTDWALGACGFDSISTEAGTSEFTATDCGVSLQWYNELTTYTANTYPGKRVYIKMVSGFSFLPVFF
jgi:hypothetical protein